jgi:TolB-like protein
MKQRIFLAGVLMLVCSLAVFAQNRRSVLAILPFTGGQAVEGETVAELFSYDNQLMGRFGILPRTSIASAVDTEQIFQRSSGMTDADTIAELGKRLGAQYVMAGSITALGSQKLLVVTIIEIETGRQVAGDYITYTAEEELRGKVPDVTQKLLPMLDVDTSGMEKLSILPILLGSGINTRDADTLAQILSIALIRNRSYAIYPRTASLEQVRAEFNTQLDSSITDQQLAAQLGRGENPRQVLSVAARRLGESNMFNASIIYLEDGTLAQGTSEPYANLNDGIAAIDIIARTLSGQDVSQTEQRRREQNLTSQANREEAARRSAEAREKFNRNAGLLFLFGGAVDFIGKDLITQRIFDEPPSVFEGVPDEVEKDANGNIISRKPGDATKAPSRTGILVDVLGGFQYSWFSISTGLSVGIGFDGPSQMEYSYLQVPLVARGEWGNREGTINFTLFGGAGINFPLTATAQLAEKEWGPKTTYNATLSMSPSLLFGAGITTGSAGGFGVHVGFRGIVDLSETTVTLSDNRIGVFKRPFQPELTLGFKYRVPFYKGR